MGSSPSSSSFKQLPEGAMVHARVGLGPLHGEGLAGTSLGVGK